MAPDDRSTWRARVRGCLLGGALGDALGAGFEGQPAVSAAALERVVVAGSELVWTDDTALQLASAGYLAGLESLEDFDDDAHAHALAWAWQKDPHRGYGANPPRVFGTVLARGDWRAAARGSFGGVGSLGNGGAMRAAPIGTSSADPAVVADLARRCAAVTHAHPVGQDAAALVAVAAARALRTPAGQRLDAEQFVGDCARWLTTPEVREAVSAVRVSLQTADPVHVARSTGNGIRADDAVAAALSAFLHHPRQPLAAIRFAVGMGGDTDTIAAMAGSLAGAAAGCRALPARLLERLESREEIEHVADDLARRTQPAGQEGRLQ